MRAGHNGGHIGAFKSKKGPLLVTIDQSIRGFFGCHNKSVYSLTTIAFATSGLINNDNRNIVGRICAGHIGGHIGSFESKIALYW